MFGHGVAVSLCRCFHCQPLLNKIRNKTGSTKIINADNTLDLDAFADQWGAAAYPMPFFPEMWEVQNWRQTSVAPSGAGSALEACAINAAGLRQRQKDSAAAAAQALKRRSGAGDAAVDTDGLDGGACDDGDADVVSPPPVKKKKGRPLGMKSGQGRAALAAASAVESALAAAGAGLPGHEVDSVDVDDTTPSKPPADADPVKAAIAEVKRTTAKSPVAAVLRLLFCLCPCCRPCLTVKMYAPPLYPSGLFDGGAQHAAKSVRFSNSTSFSAAERSTTEASAADSR